MEEDGESKEKGSRIQKVNLITVTGKVVVTHLVSAVEFLSNLTWAAIFT